MLSLTDPRVEVLMHHLYTRPDGITAKGASVLLEPPMSRRTLQRWLAGLVASGLLAAKGKGVATRYLAPTQRRGRKPRLVAPSRVAPATSGGVKPPLPVTSTPAAGPAPVPTAAARQAAPVSGTSLSPTIAAERVPAILAGVIESLVMARIAPSQLRQELGPKALFVLRRGESFDDFLALVTDALDRLTLDEAVRRGVKPEVFLKWREIDWPAMIVAAPLAPSSAPLPPPPPTPSITAERAQYLLGYLPDLVRERVTPANVRPWLEKRGRTALRGAETLDDWCTLMSAALSRLRIEDGAKYNLTPEQFRLWRKNVWPV